MFAKINGTTGFFRMFSAVASWVLIALNILLFAKSKTDAFLLGLLTYGIYNATNHATIRDWTVLTVVFDTLWGGVVCLTAYTLFKKIKI